MQKRSLAHKTDIPRNSQTHTCSDTSNHTWNRMEKTAYSTSHHICKHRYTYRHFTAFMPPKTTTNPGL